MLYCMHVKWNGDFTIHHEQIVPNGQIVTENSNFILNVSIFFAQFTVRIL